MAAMAASFGPLSTMLRTGVGMAAHNVCSSTFISGRPEEETRQELVGLLMGPPERLLRIHVDRAQRTVDASLLFERAKAEFVPGYGCRLKLGLHTAPLTPRPTEPPAIEDAFAPAGQVTSSDPDLVAALDREFTEMPGESLRRVKAVVIVKDGHVVAERYAPGFHSDTPVVSFSVAKSLTNALLAILVREGKLSMDQPAGIAEWKQPGDPRAAIRPDDLLRMASGLDAAETGSGRDPASIMFYAVDDMAAYSASRPLAQSPGTVWEYTSNNTLILDRLVGQLVGGGPSGLREFAQTELFAPIGMSHVIMEFDGAGTFIGASHVYATPRDFARFGLLYLNDGVSPDGRRILPEGWVAYSRRATAGSPYGAGFWTNDGTSEVAAARVANGFPKDGFFASGNLGQRIYIIPSEHLVIARFGYSAAPTFGIGVDLQLIAAAIKTLKSG